MRRPSSQGLEVDPEPTTLPGNGGPSRCGPGLPKPHTPHTHVQPRRSPPRLLAARRNPCLQTAGLPSRRRPPQA